jgi:molybdopterin synthase sulfur carrier subunit
MSIVLRVPYSLSKLIGNTEETICVGNTIETCIIDIAYKFPAFQKRMMDSHGEFNSDMLVFLNGENIFNLDKKLTAVNDGDEISIVPFAAGG